MIDALAIALQLAGAGLILLAVAHVPIGIRLRWREDGARLSPVNAAIFRVHAFFICLVLVLMGLPCLLDPLVFLEPTRAGAWLSWSCAAFWAARLYCQFFIYAPDLWRGKALETRFHWGFSVVWFALTALFTACGLRQSGWSF